MVVVGEVCVGLFLVKCVIIFFMDFSWDGMYLNNVFMIFKFVWGGLVFLQLYCVVVVVLVCELFIDKKLIKDGLFILIYQFMEMLVDVVFSIDYYFEGMEDNKFIGDGIFEVVEESMCEFGFLVVV